MDVFNAITYVLSDLIYFDKKALKQITLMAKINYTQVYDTE